MTGITGSLGSAIAGRILDDGGAIKAVVRADNQTEASVRVQKAIEIAASRKDLRNVTVVAGDVCLANLGISVESVRDVSMIVHCAANLDFSEESAAVNHDVNVNGTVNALRLAETLRVPVCHVSTAYVAGRRQGVVREDELDVGQDFHNSYERTKCLAEQEVRRWSQATGLAAYIFRPSIIVGDSKTGRIVNFDGMYNLLRFFDNIADMVGDEEFRAAANPRATKNFIPVDAASAMIWNILKSGQGGVYHITHPEPMSLARLREIFVVLFSLRNARFVHEDDFRRSKPSRLERLYQRASAVYEPYLRDEPRFDRTQTERVLTDGQLRMEPMDIEFFQRLVAYARLANWGKSSPELSADSGCRYSQVVEDYFSVFLADKMHRRLLTDPRHLSATCRICVSDVPRKNWSLELKDGCLENVSLNGLAYQCTFFMDGETFTEITSGRLSPRKAFFLRKVDIEGDINMGLKLATVLAAFFRKFPYQEHAADA
jgi:thioester reductase-like protein/predicted lipid carrier protein YhbT